MAGSSFRNAFVATYDSHPRFRHLFHDVIHLVRRGAPMNELHTSEIPAAWRATIQLADATHSPKVLSRKAHKIRQLASGTRELHSMLTTAHTSMRVLSWSPVVLAALLMLASQSARSFTFGSPVGLMLGLAGIGLHLLGRAWLSRLFVEPTESLDIELIESLAAALAVGYTTPQAIELLSQWSSDPVVQRARTRLPFGLGEALHELGERSPDVMTAVSLIEQATRDGLPVTESLDEFTEAVRARRAEEYRAHIRTMSVKANIPLVVCILPSFILLTLSPLVAVILSPLGVSGP